MNVFATLVSVLAVASVATASGLTLGHGDLEEEVFFEVDDLSDDAPDSYVSAQNVTTEQKLQSMGIEARWIHPSIWEDANLLVPDLIRKYGYGCEVHHVTTSDGYILEMHRITSSPREPGHINRNQKQPVFMMHGLLDASSGYVIMGPYNGLAYLMADRGYDVWLGNARGNTYSRRHTRLNPDGRRSERRDFWNFSWHEIGMIDLPAMIDYVLWETRFDRLHYVGHSQGTTSFFVMASMLPHYNDKIITMQALAPVAFMSNLESPLIRLAATFQNTLDFATSVLGMYEFLPNNDMLGSAANLVCSDASFVQALCSNFLFLIAGSNPAQLNSTMIPVIAGHTPAGASTNNLVHYGQLMRSGHFRQYDHGRITNRARYGSFSPPAYPLHNIRAPVALHFSQNDWLAHVDDVARLHRSLPNTIGLFLVPDPRFNHLDFSWAIDAEVLLFNRVFEIMRIYEGRH